MKIIIAIDSFKDCLSSSQISRLVAIELQNRDPQIEVSCIPITDGGEGWIEAISDHQSSTVHTTAHDALMRPIECHYIITDSGKTAIIEMASAAGLMLVEQEHRNPLHTTTYGVGQMIADALDRGCRRFIIGIGGSATNDAGTGMLQALGFRFLDDRANCLFGSGENLEKISAIDTQHIHPMLGEASFEIACDVTNPLYGAEGAAYVYAPQKGANASTVERLDAGLRNFASIVFQTSGINVQTIDGAGAAGGVGAGAVAFLGARLSSGIDLVLDHIDFDRIARGASLIITGEGKMDRQTLMGKTPLGILRRALKHATPIIALAGRVENRDELRRAGFAELFEISPRDMPLSEATKPDVVAMNIHRVINSGDFQNFVRENFG